MNGSETFQSMGCEIVVAGASALTVRRIRQLFEHRDRVFSRFRPDVNSARGGVVRLSPLFASTLHTALDIADATDGLVDPALGAAIEAAGYTADFAELAADPRTPALGAPGAWHSL